MDKRILNAEELNYLKHFIMSRGFHDEGTILEILDHFACKVEDLMHENLNMQFEEAVRTAHESFGVMGFRNIVAAYEKQVNRKYRVIYFTELKKTLMNIPYVMICLLVSFFVYKGYIWSVHHPEVFSNLIEYRLFVFIALVIPDLILGRMKPRKNHNNLILAAGFVQGLPTFPILVAFIVGGVPRHPTENNLQLAAIIMGIFFLAYSINFLPRYNTFMKAIKEYKELKQYA